MIDLDTWNLSVPVGTPSTTIDTPALVQGYQDKYFKPTPGTVFFWAPVTGSRTSNASYPRSELRETYPNGGLRNWKYSQADNFMRAALMVSKVPSNGRVVIGQIHVYGSTKPMVKLEYRFRDGTGQIVAKVRLKPEDKRPQVIQIASDVPLDKRFTYSLHVNPKGKLGVSAAGFRYSTILDSAWAQKPLYYKAGVYPQDNTGYPTEGGQATFFKLQVEHRDPNKPTDSL